MIDLISDTVTRPTPAMIQHMMQAPVGDDVFQADPSVNTLQEYAANLLGMEAALFCPSGTMTNQIAIQCHTRPMDELICDITSHVYQYENGGYGYHSGLGIQLLHGNDGKLTPELISSAKRPDLDWLPNSQLVVIENSINKAGGNIYTYDEMKAISRECEKLNLSIHLDGARLFNVLVETGDRPSAIGPLFDSISICLSKGLGAPVGSLLLGSKNFIKRARKIRKAMGGGMRQAGYLAAAGLYALENHIPQLKDDNNKAKKLAECLSQLSWVDQVKPVHTNIVIFDLQPSVNTEEILQNLLDNQINASAFGPKSIRFVTHRDISDSQINTVCDYLKTMNQI